MKNILMGLATAMLASVALVMPSGAQTASENTANLTIKATFKAGCTLNFDNGGTYDLGTFSNLKRAFPENGMTGRFTFSCTNGSSIAKGGVQLALNGNDGANQEAQRYLYTSAANVPQRIPVNVYIGGTASGDIWGDGKNGTSQMLFNDNPNGRYEFTMQIPASPNLDHEFNGNFAGYSNTFVATVVYDASGE